MQDGFAYHKIIVDKSGKPIDYVFLEVNHAFEKMTGLKRERIIGKKVTEILLGIEKDPANWIGVYGKVALTGKPAQFENHAENLGKWFKVVAYCPEKCYFVALLEDITERKKAENSLRLSEENYRHLLQNAPTAIYEIDYNTPRFKSVNDAMTVLTGYFREELLALNPADLLDHESKIRFQDRIRRGLVGEKIDENVEYRAIVKGGRELWVVLNVKLTGRDGKYDGALVVGYDVTERKKAEEEIARLASFPTLNPNPIIELDFEGKIEYINPAAKAKFTDLETLGVNHPFFANWKSVTKALTKKPTKIFACEVKIGDDWYLQNYSNVPNSQCIRVYALNITGRKQAEEAIKRQAELIDLSPDAITVRKIDGTISFWSEGAEKMYGWKKEEAVGQNINHLLKTKFKIPLKEIIKKVELEGKWSGEIEHTCANGHKIVVQSSWLGKFGADGKMLEMLESNVDITERIRMQTKAEESAVLLEEYATQMEELANKRAEQLKDAERLAAIGATAGMVGHDIRNPLQAITGDIYLAKSELDGLPDGEEKKAILESLVETEKNVDYINKIVADLQDFARPLRPNFEETNLKPLIDDLLKKNGLPENVKVTVKVEPEAGKFVADSSYINRIMYNLVNNAIQAMPKGGKLTIHAYKEAKDVLITVKDTGVGIPEKVKGKLFTPMFTTKSKGQGFGLAVIKRMTESLGGTVSFESQEGKGTMFTIHLPISKETKSKGK